MTKPNKPEPPDNWLVCSWCEKPIYGDGRTCKCVFAFVGGLAAVVVVLAVFLFAGGCTYYPRDANGNKHAPWRDDPSLADDHWLDNFWIKGGEEELEKRLEWERINPPVDMGDKMLR